jgi:hypothetical protein
VESRAGRQCRVVRIRRGFPPVSRHLPVAPALGLASCVVCVHLLKAPAARPAIGLERKMQRTWYWIIAAIVVVLAIIFFMRSGTEAPAPTAPAATEAPATPDAPAAPAN